MVMNWNAKKEKISHVQDEWFFDKVSKGIISNSHSKNTETSVFCLICQKSANVAHQGKKDLLSHCQGASHVGKANSECQIAFNLDSIQRVTHWRLKLARQRWKWWVFFSRAQSTNCCSWPHWATCQRHFSIFKNC